MRSSELTNGDNERVPQLQPFGSELNSVGFAAVARTLGDTARSKGWPVPAFRSPPRSLHLDRSIRHERDGSATISVRLRQRPGVAVISDMIEGVIKAAELDETGAAELRDDAWRAVAGLFETTKDPKVSPLPVLKAA